MKSEVTIHDKRFGHKIGADTLAARVSELAHEIDRDLEGEEPLVIVVLQGAFMFAADLLREMSADPEIGFIRLKSYEGTRSSGSVRFMPGFDISAVEGRSVLVIEDIIESGLTLNNLEQILMEAGASDMKVATLLLKPELNRHGVRPDYIGFEIPNDFVVGYGLDYNQRGRSLPGIYSLISEG